MANLGTVRNVSAAYVCKGTDQTLVVDASAGAVTIVLPLESADPGRLIVVIKSDPTLNPVSIIPPMGYSILFGPALTLQGAVAVFELGRATLWYTVASAGGGGGAAGLVDSTATNVGLVPIFAGQAVATDASGVGFVLASSINNNKNAIGLAVGDALPGAACTVQLDGTLSLADWTASTGAAALLPKATYFLDPTFGKMKSTPPSNTGEVVQVMGTSLSPTEFRVEVAQSIIL